MIAIGEYPTREVPPFLAGGGTGTLLNSNRYFESKRAGDFIFAALLLFLTWPLMILAMALVKLTSPGPALYSQARLGRHGRLFWIYKIRTMAQDCERHAGRQWASADDPRVTPVGRFLRASHLDELPQLWNVVRGEMSLVGPRPERPEIVTQLERALPEYRDRMQVLPGVTGLAQVQLPPDATLMCVRRKLACDLVYVQRIGAVLDLKILVTTVLKVAGVPTRHRCRLLRIPIVAGTADDPTGGKPQAGAA